jgi:cytochrome P450
VWPTGSSRFASFGAGPHICIGAAFALQEASLLQNRITEKFTLIPAEPGKLEPLPRITLRPGDGLPMRLHRRNP